MSNNAGAIETQDLTPYFTEAIKTAGKIKEARLAKYEDGSKAMEIMFYDHVPKIERYIMIIAIGENLLRMCIKPDKEEQDKNAPLLEFINEATIKEWSET